MDHNRPESIEGYVHPEEAAPKPVTGQKSPYSVYSGKKKGPVYKKPDTDNKYKSVDTEEWSTSGEK